MSLLKPLVIFDRDGTIIEHVHHLHRKQDVKIVAGAITSLQRLKDQGFAFGIATNQSVISLGLATHEEVDRINTFISQLFEASGIYFDFIRVCPHQKSSHCLCRKPKTGMVEDIHIDLHYNLKESYMVGDSLSDAQFGQELGLNSILIGKKDSGWEPKFLRVDSILDVSEVIIQNRLH
jgi:D-glycero-D-manno-heptose 1,7-bisphosphate phosphatase